MNNNNVVLISLQEDVEIIGLKYLHYILIENGYNSNLLYLPNSCTFENVKLFIEKLNPLFIGISLMSSEYKKAQMLTRNLKLNFDIPVIWGGIHSTISPETCLEDADYVCIGEGEKTIVDFANAIRDDEDTRKIYNLCYLQNGNVQINALYPLVEDLDSIPLYDFIPVDSYIQNYDGNIISYEKIYKKYSRFKKQYSIISSRGCPFSCTYCCNNFLSKLYPNSKVRRRSVENIIFELERAVNNQNIDLISFQDDCFLSNSEEYIKNFCEEYKLRVNKPFSTHGIPVYVTRNKIEMLEDAGLSWINLGLQSGSDRVNRDIYRRKSLKQDFIRAAKIVKECGVASFCDLILDNPFETEEDSLETIYTIMETPKPFYPQFFSLNLYAGTELYEKARKYFQVENFVDKNYSFYRKNTINNMIRLSVFLDAKYMRVIVKQYMSNPNGLFFKFLIMIANLLSFTVLEFFTYFEIIRISCKGSYVKAIKTLPNYFRKGIWFYLIQFRINKNDQRV